MGDFREFVNQTYKTLVEPYRNYNISLDQMMYLNAGVEELKPKRFFEVGTCTGTSTGYIANMLQRNGGEELVTIDLLDEWKYEEKADGTQQPMQSKVIGHMIPVLYKGGEVDVTQHTLVNSTIMPSLTTAGLFDMGFIDAAHVHPWPTLDAIACFPFVKSGSRVYFHDVNLHKMLSNANSNTAMGVKFLFDQIPDVLKDISTSDPYRNIGYITIPKAGFKTLTEAIIESLFVPWTNPHRIGHSVIKAYAKLALDHWGEDVANAVLLLSNKYNTQQTYRFSMDDLKQDHHPEHMPAYKLES